AYFPAIKADKTDALEVTLGVPAAPAASGASIEFSVRVGLSKNGTEKTISCPLVLTTLATLPNPEPAPPAAPPSPPFVEAPAPPARARPFKSLPLRGRTSVRAKQPLALSPPSRTRTARVASSLCERTRNDSNKGRCLADPSLTRRRRGPSLARGASLVRRERL